MLNQIITHYTWPITLLFFMNICSPIFEHSAPLSYSSFTHYIVALNRRAYFTMDYRNAHVFSVKKVDDSANLTAA
jgi:hypothetical protein